MKMEKKRKDGHICIIKPGKFEENVGKPSKLKATNRLIGNTWENT